MRISPTPGRAIFRALASICLLFSPLAELQTQAVPLKASIQHTERMPSVDPALKAGAQFNLSATEEEPQNFWVRIPDWLAGTWLVETETRVYHHDYRANTTDNSVMPFKARSRFTYGKQTDRKGGIWHFLGVPYCSATDFPTFTEYHQVASKQCLDGSPTHISMRTHFTVIRVNKTTRKVTETFQQESITTYTRAAPGELKLESSTKVFDAAGAPTHLARNEATVARTEPYTPVDSEAGKNMHELFRQFLIAHRMLDILPD
ncbi:MAG TPA: hypothetical protein V6C81_16850 [Planktothrix sp.]|jgi:hypothetical protein